MRIITYDNAAITSDVTTADAPEVVNAATLTTRAGAALTANATFLAIATPTAAQVDAQVSRLTKENNALIRLAIGLLADVTDTA